MQSGDEFTSRSLYDGLERDAPPESAPPAQVAYWEDFMDIIYAPAAVFARRATSGFAVPMLVVTVLLTLSFVVNRGVLQPIMDAEFTRGVAAAMRKDPRVTLEQMAGFRTMMEKFVLLFAVVGPPVVMLLVGLGLWVTGKLVEARQTLGAATMVACYAYVPRVLASIVSGVEGLVMDPAALTGQYSVSIGPGRFLDPDATAPLLLALVGRLDLFTLWTAVLLAIGLSVTGRIPRRQAAMAAVLVWILGAVPAFLTALRG